MNFISFRTIRSKLLFSFLIFLFITTFVILSNIWFKNKEQELKKTSDVIAHVNQSLQTIQKLELVFLVDETINEYFYKTGSSEVLAQRKELVNQIKEELDFLKNNANLTSDTDEDIDFVIENFDQHEKVFAELVSLTQKRGFKNYGIEGDMRAYIHKIENSDFQFDLTQLLTIRRHEKDFIIRKQKEYIQKHSDAVALLEKNANNATLKQLLKEYKKAFIELATLEEKIGFDNGKGLKKELSNVMGMIEKSIAKLSENTYQIIERLSNQNNMIQFGIIFISILIIVILTFTISRNIGRPINKLSVSIHEIIKNDFSKDFTPITIDTKDEIGRLSQDVASMVKTVQDNIIKLKQKNIEVEEKQKAIMDSVVYAESMQKSMLSEQNFGNYFDKFFVIYRPKYEVAGDFYWMKRVKDKYFCAVMDCKGIGLSGAIMTMMTNTLLNQIVENEMIDNPASILEMLDREMKIILPQGFVKMGLICIEQNLLNDKYKKITYAGANIPLFYSNGLELVEVNPQHQVVGLRESKKKELFENQTFNLHDNEIMYFTTDGLIKQYLRKEKGKEDEIASGKKYFKDLIQRNIHRYTVDQESSFNQEIERLLGLSSGSQVDDITILAIKPRIKDDNQSKDKSKDLVLEY